MLQLENCQVIKVPDAAIFKKYFMNFTYSLIYLFGTENTKQYRQWNKEADFVFKVEVTKQQTNKQSDLNSISF